MNSDVAKGSTVAGNKPLPWVYKLLSFVGVVLLAEILIRILNSFSEISLLVLLFLILVCLAVQAIIFRRLSREGLADMARDFKRWTIAGYLLFAAIYILPMLLALIFGYFYR